MAKKKQIKASELKGMNIYQDSKHGTVYYDWLSKKGFQLTTSDVRWYNLSQAFLPITVVIMYACNVLFKLTISASIIIGLIAYVVMRMVYRFKFLNSLPCIENYKTPGEGNVFTNTAKNYSKARLILLTILSIALIGVTIAYIILEKPEGIAKIGMYVLTVAAGAMLVFSGISLIIKEKGSK